VRRLTWQQMVGGAAPMLALAAVLLATATGSLDFIRSPLLVGGLSAGFAAAAGAVFGMIGLGAAGAVLLGIALVAHPAAVPGGELAWWLPPLGCGAALSAVGIRRGLTGWQRRRVLSAGAEIERLRARVKELESLQQAGSAAAVLGAASDAWIAAVDRLAESGAAMIARMPEGLVSSRDAKAFAAAVREARRGLLAQAALAGSFSLEAKREASLEDAVHAAVDATKAVFDERAVTLTCDTSAAGTPCVLDDKLLAVAIAALLSNAAEASPRGGAVHLVAHADYRGERGLIEVTDKGSGISPDVIPHVFKPFFSTRPGKLGLGLASAREIVAKLGGSIAVSANELRGMTFRIRIPMRRATLEGETADREAEQSRRQARESELAGVTQALETVLSALEAGTPPQAAAREGLAVVAAAAGASSPASKASVLRAVE
jgi:signal transduction histidine kinase